MKTPIRDARIPQRSVVPIAPFEFEKFELRVRTVTRQRPALIGALLRKSNGPIPKNQARISIAPADAATSPRIFPPSPSPQGLGLVCLRLETRSAAKPTASTSGARPSRSRSGIQRGAAARPNRLFASQPN